MSSWVDSGWLTFDLLLRMRSSAGGATERRDGAAHEPGGARLLRRNGRRRLDRDGLAPRAASKPGARHDGSDLPGHPAARLHASPQGAFREWAWMQGGQQGYSACTMIRETPEQLCGGEPHATPADIAE